MVKVKFPYHTCPIILSHPFFLSFDLSKPNTYGKHVFKYLQVKSREVEMMALQEERHRREELERKLHEETQLREELVTQQIKFREKQKQQVQDNHFITLLLGLKPKIVLVK